MNHGDTTFHCDVGHENAPIIELKNYRPGDTLFTVQIAQAGSVYGGILIFCDEQQLIAFKNSVISEYERIRRERDGR